MSDKRKWPYPDVPHVEGLSEAEVVKWLRGVTKQVDDHHDPNKHRLKGGVR